MTIDEILDREVPLLFPSIAYSELRVAEWLGRQETTCLQGDAFWEQRLVFLLFVQEALS